MERTVAMPKLGMTMTEGVLLRWHVAEGDEVAKDDVLAEVETDKVELEVEAPSAGRVLRLVAEEGQTISVGAPLLLLATDAEKGVENGAGAPPSTSAVSVPSPAAASALPPATTLASPNAKPPAAALPRVAGTPAARRIAREHGLDLAEVARARAQEAGAKPLYAADVLAAVSSRVVPSNVPAFTPLARKVAQANGLSPDALVRLDTTDGETRRISRAMVEAAVAAREQNIVIAASTSESEDTKDTTEDSIGTTSSEEQITLSAMRRVIAERTAHSFTTTPHIYLDTEVDMTEAEAVRAAFARDGGSAPSVTALLVRIAGQALRQHPEVNAGFATAMDGRTAAIRRWRDVHIGVAVAVPDGLLVPVVRHADQKALPQIAGELADLTRRACEGGLMPDELAGATFSISNLGMYGIDTFHAILNEPQAAILAVGRVTRRPVVLQTEQDGEIIAIRPMLKLSLSADHRVLDGATGARFLATLTRLLADPRRLI